MPKARTYIRQNPRIATDPPGSEWCPKHGAYLPDPEAKRLQRDAVAEGVEARKARAMLDRSAEIRRRCPECGQARPIPTDYFAELRRQLRPASPQFVMPPRHLVDPEASEVGT